MTVAWGFFAALGVLSGLWAALFAWLEWRDRHPREPWEGCSWCWRPRLAGHGECVEHIRRVTVAMPVVPKPRIPGD